MEFPQNCMLVAFKYHLRPDRLERGVQGTEQGWSRTANGETS